MVASANSDLYTPFPHGMLHEEALSSEDGSGLHSPIFGAHFPPHGDSSLRYQQEQLDIQQAAGVLSSHFEYNVPSIPYHQPGLLGATIDNSNIDAHQHRILYSPEYPPPTRQNFGFEYTVLSLPTSSRLPPPPAQIGSVDYDFPDRRLSGGPSHDHPYPRAGVIASGIPMDEDHRESSSSTEPNEASANIDSTDSKELRKETSTVVIACRQCRARKIRCDSTRPVCNNCVRRSNECQYDAAPKRRGPDKRPGTRQRSCKKRPADGSAPPPPSKRKRSTTLGRSPRNSESGIKHSPSPPASAYRGDIGREHTSHGRSSPMTIPSTRISPQHGEMKSSPQNTTRRHPSFFWEEDPYHQPSRTRPIDTRRNDPEDDEYEISMVDKHWWEDLVGTYSSTPEQSLKDITGDLTFLFSNTMHELTFVDPTSFLRKLLNEDERIHIQPSFVLAGLALATLMKSSDVELGLAGRNRALWLRDAAQASLETAWGSQLVDQNLAEAALIIALFESSPHPQHTPERAASSLAFLDNIIRFMSLAVIDRDDPDVSTFASDSVPVVGDSSEAFRGTPVRDRKCHCIPISSHSEHHSVSWTYALPWDPNWSDSESHKEECRRLCWSALSLVASYTAECEAFSREPMDLYLSNPVNFALLFPGEVSDRFRPSQVTSPKESVWALYCRSMLLWNFCSRLRGDTASDEDKAESAIEAWTESQAIQDSLDSHVCNIDTSIIYMCKEYLYNTRMIITRAFRSLQYLDSGSVPSSPVPTFNRKQAEEWLCYQKNVMKRVRQSIQHLGDTQGHTLTRRPFQATWFSSQLAMCLLLWTQDRTLYDALELGKSILIPVDVLNALWPSSEHQRRCDELREKLTLACTTVGAATPLPADFSLPISLRSR